MSEVSEQSSLTLEIPSFQNNSPIPGDYAFCVPDPANKVTLGPNRNPHLRWANVPEGTESFALIVFDPDVPSEGDKVNKEGETVPAALPRVDFYHWVLVDIPATLTEIPEGADSNGVTAGGKEVGSTEYGLRGYNNYTLWFAGDADMSGVYAGYDGPCPPWNDELLHHYIFRLYALKVPSLGLSGTFGGADALKALEPHIIGQAEWVGLYTFNPDLYPNS